jgi:hypothetical protein
MENLIIREYQPGDETGILALYHAVFGVTLAPETWKWFYQDVPEHPTAIVVAENASGIVGHYGIQPRPFWLCGQPCLAGLTVGTMVHPTARNLTTLVKMAQMAYDRCRQRGVSFLYSFSRDEAWKVRQVVLGWQALSQLTAWEGRLQPFVWGQGTTTALYETLDREAIAQLQIPIAVESYGGIGRRITPAWLHWRFFQNPIAHYSLIVAGSLAQPQGCAVLKVYEKEGVRYGHIVDWQVPEGEIMIAKTLLSEAWQTFLDRQVERISCWAMPRSSLAHLLQDMGLTQSGPTTNFGYLNLSADHEDSLATANHWNIFMGDSDVY